MSSLQHKEFLGGLKTPILLGWEKPSRVDKEGSGGIYSHAGMVGTSFLERFHFLFLRRPHFLPVSHQAWVIIKYCQMVPLS